MRRLIFGIIAASVVFPSLLAIIGVFQYISESASYRMYFSSAAWLLIFTLPAMIGIGLPAHLIAHQRGVTTLTTYLFGGLVIGAFGAFALSFAYPFGYRLIKSLVWGGAVGIGSALAFWMVAISGPNLRGQARNKK